MLIGQRGHLHAEPRSNHTVTYDGKAVGGNLGSSYRYGTRRGRMLRRRSHSYDALVTCSHGDIFSRTRVYTITSTNCTADSAGDFAIYDLYA